MSSRWAKGDTMLIVGLVAFGIFAVLSGIFLTRLVTLDVLERDARYLATLWAQHVSAQMGRPATIVNDSASGYGLRYVEPPRPSRTDTRVSTASVGTVSAAAPSTATAPTSGRATSDSNRPRYRPEEVLAFRRGEHFSVVRRFALFRTDR